MSALRLPSGLLEEIPPFRSRSLSEATLFDGHRGAATYLAVASPVTSACACGLAIVARSLVDEDVVEAVRAHHRMPEHQLYRLRQGGA